MSATSNQTISEAVDALRDLRISVDFTDQPIEPDFTKVDENGLVSANVALITVTKTGRAFIEVFDGTDSIRQTVLDYALEDVELARTRRGQTLHVSLGLHPDTVLELREWAELRDSVEAA